MGTFIFLCILGVALAWVGCVVCGIVAWLRHLPHFKWPERRPVNRPDRYVGVGEHLIYVFDGTTGKRLCVLNRDTVAKVIGTQRVEQILTGHL